MSDQILIVGCGSIGERHLRCFQKSGRADLAVCDTNAALLERLQKEYHVPAFANLEAAFSSRRFDGLVICTPAHTHLDLALAGLQQGAALLIEKPLSVSFDQVHFLRDKIAEKKNFVAVAYVYHFMPWVREARAELQKGSLGRPLQVSVAAGQHFPTFRPAYREIYYARHETGGGAIQDALTHLINAVEWLVGPTSQVFCVAAHQALDGVKVEDTVCVTARNQDIPVSYALNQFQAPNEVTLQVHCENGSLKIEGHERRWAVWPRGAAAWQYHPAPATERDDWFIAQANAFLDGLRGRTTGLCTFDEAVQTLKVNLAALESARTGQSVVIV